MVPPTGIEPVSSDFQSAAMTTFATVGLNNNMGYFRPIEIETGPLTVEAHHWIEQTKKENFMGDKSFRLRLNIERHVNPALLEFLDKRNYFVRYGEIFYTAIDRESKIHSDGDPREYTASNDMAKINHIVGGRDSLMNWYQPKAKKEYQDDSQANSKYTFYEHSEVELVASAHLQGWNIVQVAPPHNIVNRITRRVCTSLTIRQKSSPDRMPTYQQLVQDFT